MCGIATSENGPAFKASLGPKGDVPGRRYIFKRVVASEDNGSYANIMVRDCQRHGMKPVCEHPKNCKNDSKALYIGNTHHLEYPGQRKNLGFFPSGWSKIQRRFDGLCAYTGKAHGQQALCNVPKNSHNWKKPNESEAFMCGKVEG